MFYGRRFFATLYLLLSICLSVTLAVGFSVFGVKTDRAIAATSSALTLGDLNASFDKVALTAGDDHSLGGDYTISGGKFANDDDGVKSNKFFEEKALKLGSIKLADTNEIVLDLQLKDKKGTFYLAFLRGSQYVTVGLRMEYGFQLSVADKTDKNSSMFTDADVNGFYRLYVNLTNKKCSATVTKLADDGVLSLSDVTTTLSTTSGSADVYVFHTAAAVVDVYGAHYNVKFDYNGGTTSVKVNRGETVSENSLPTVQSYTENGVKYAFDCWTCDGKDFDLNAEINSSLTLTAKYKKIDEESKGSVTVTDANGKILKKFGAAEFNSMDADFDKTSVETNYKKLKGFAYNGNLYRKLSDLPELSSGNDLTVVAEVITVYTEFGASVRAVAPSGIRFTGRASTNCGEYGIFLTPKVYLGEESNMTLEYLDASKKAYEKITSSTPDMKQSVNGGVSEFSIVLTDLKNVNYGAEFAARTFVEVTYFDGTSGYVYSDFSFEDNARSVYEVACSVVGETGSDDAVLKSFVNSVIELKTVDGGGYFAVENALRDFSVEKVYALGDYVYVELNFVGDCSVNDIHCVLSGGLVYACSVENVSTLKISLTA